MKHLAWFLSLTVGFLSLSQEIVWIRVVGFAFETLPQSFSFVLGLFLAGIALGALAGKRLCQGRRDIPAATGWVLLGAGLLDLSLVKLLPLLFHSPLPALGLALAIGGTAAAKGMVFPMVHHMGSVADAQLGRSVSRVYFMNIIGATLGPLVTGLVLLDMLSASAMFVFIAGGTLLVAAIALASAGSLGRKPAFAWIAILAAILAGGTLLQLETRDDSLVRAIVHAEAGALRYVVENRHGIIHVVSGNADDDMVFGGNVYDGRTNIDLRNNSNHIDRAYLLASLHPTPRRALVIGLSTGAWTRILTANRNLETIDVVEINPGYIQLLRQYPELAPLLDDPRVNIHFDDGRRWLRRHTGNRFDLILMNTSLHWRANATNLLSQEMQELIHSALAPAGIFAFNATGSDDVFLTASKIFNHAYLYRNFVYASDHDFRSQKTQIASRLFEFRLEGIPLFNTFEGQDMTAIDKMLAIPFVTVEEVMATHKRPLEMVTDQNMITEFRHGRRLF